MIVFWCWFILEIILGVFNVYFDELELLGNIIGLFYSMAVFVKLKYYNFWFIRMKFDVFYVDNFLYYFLKYFLFKGF